MAEVIRGQVFSDHFTGRNKGRTGDIFLKKSEPEPQHRPPRFEKAHTTPRVDPDAQRGLDKALRQGVLRRVDAGHRPVRFTPVEKAIASLLVAATGWFVGNLVWSNNNIDTFNTRPPAAGATQLPKP